MLILRQARPSGPACGAPLARPPVRLEGFNQVETPPRPPHKTSFQRACLCCLMDKSTYGMDMWTRLHLDHIPTPPEPLTTGGRPPGLTRFACPRSASYRFKRIPGTCPPCLPDGGGLELGDSFALPRRGAVWCYPLDTAGRSRGHRIGGKRASRSPLQPRS